MTTTTADLSRWREKPRGLAYRRWSIVSTGLRLHLRTRFFKTLVIVAWTAGLLMAVMGFVFSQSVSSGGWLETLASRLGPRMQAVEMAIGGLFSLYPDVCIGGSFTVIFWLHSFVGLWLTLIALTAMVPKLVTRDRATHALTVYLSRPLTSVDYLFGKLGMIVAMILLVWTGPLLFGWLVSMLFATDRDFVVYSLEPLGRALLFNLIGVIALSAIALGASAISRTSRATVTVWMVLWLVCGTLAAVEDAPAWVQRLSFTDALHEVRQQVLRLDVALTEAAATLPLLSKDIQESLASGGRNARPQDVTGALGALAAFVALSSVVFFRKLRAAP